MLLYYKMDKKGFLLAEETMKIILGLIAIGFLVFLLTSVYFSFKSSDKLELAKASLDHIISEINAGNTRVEIFNPEKYWLLSNDVKGELCICKDNEYLSCAEEGICEKSDFTLNEPFEINKPPVTIELNQDEKSIFLISG